MRAKSQKETAADKSYKRAEAKFKAALRLKPDDYSILFKWGNAITKLADTKEGVAADKLNRLAETKYKAALHIEPDKYEALCNWGT